MVDALSSVLAIATLLFSGTVSWITLMTVWSQEEDRALLFFALTGGLTVLNFTVITFIVNLLQGTLTI